MNFVDGSKQDDINQMEYVEVAVAKMIIDKPYACQALKPTRVKEKANIMAKTKDVQYYFFDINKVDEIFDLLLANGQIKLTVGQVIPNKDELVRKKYCK